MIKNGIVKIENTDMYYVAFGWGKRNIVILPGLSDGLATVKGKALFMLPSYTRYLKDFTVYIFSRKNEMPEGYTIEQMADDQVKAMRTLGIEKTCVMGVSQGGMISQYIAIKYPEMVEKLVLAVTTPYANEVVTNAVSTWRDMTKRNDHTALMTDTAERMYSEKFLAKNRKMIPLLAKLTKPKSYERFYRNVDAILSFDARNRLGEIQCSTLIIAGDNDKTVGNDAPEELEKGIKNSAIHIYKGLGHGAYEEAKDFYGRVYEFFKAAES